jgi:hypothetical protein
MTVKFWRVEEQTAGISISVVLPITLVSLAYLLVFIVKFKKSFGFYARLIIAIVTLALTNLCYLFFLD